MKKQEPRIKYAEYAFTTNDVDLPINIDRVIKALTENPLFPGPIVPLNDIEKSLDSYKLYILPPGSRTSDTRDLREENKAIVVDQITKMGKWVEMTAGTDMMKLRASGFILVERSTLTSLPTEGEAKQFSTNGAGDTLEISCVTEPNTKYYEAIITIEGVAIPEKHGSTSSTITVKGLPQGKMLSVQIQKSNALGTGPIGPTYKTRLPMPGEICPKQPSKKNK